MSIIQDALEIYRERGYAVDVTRTTGGMVCAFGAIQEACGWSWTDATPIFSTWNQSEENIDVYHIIIDRASRICKELYGPDAELDAVNDQYGHDATLVIFEKMATDE